MGEIRNNVWFNPIGEAKQPISELERARDEMKAAKRQGGFAYKQARARYEKLLYADQRKKR